MLAAKKNEGQSVVITMHPCMMRKRIQRIFAGTGGFDVNVAGNTDLKGGAITSTQAAVDNNSNRFNTDGTLTLSDIQNSASYDAKAVGLNIGTSVNQSGKYQPNGTSAGIGKDSSNAASTTQAAITGIAGNKDARTGDKDSGIAKIFDADKVQKEINAQVTITQAFGQRAAKEIGTYATSKEDRLRRQADVAQKAGDRASMDALNAEADKWAEGGAYRVAMHTAVGALTGGAQGAAGAFTSAEAMPQIGKVIDGMDLPPEVKSGLAQVTATAIGSVVGGTAGAGVALNVEANNRQLHQSERDWAKQNAKKFAEFFKDKTGQTIDLARAEQMLLGNGYRMVDAAANKGPGVAGPSGDAVAVSFLAQNAGNLFKATAAEYNSPFLNGNKDGSLTPEQAALPGAKGNPAAAAGVAAIIASGGLAAAYAPQLIAAGSATAQFGADAWTAYKAASAAYSMGAALGTGIVFGGATYTGGAVVSSLYDQRYGTGQAFSSGFDQRFSYPGLGAAMTVGGLTGMYGTAMFGWAGVPNAIGNLATVPGVVIRINNAAMGQAGGRAAQSAVNSSTSR